MEIIPIQGWHHKEKKLSVLGYRFGNIAYLTDMSLLEEESYELLKGLDFVTVNCVKRAPHHSHFGLAEALEFFDRVGAKNSYLTHISHLLPGWAELEAELQAYNPTYHVAYDGLVLE
ncbi:MAG: MBL fold metallo-hydrolase [Bacteroidales bacterium]|nr:MBL fold metallo-hydrolase [Bacteroidales bacterium]